MAARTSSSALTPAGRERSLPDAPLGMSPVPLHFLDSAGALYDDAHVVACHERWMLRYELPDAYERWRAADPDKAPSLAFKAVAGDPDLLIRLDRATGKALAVQAQQVASGLVGSRDLSEETRAAAQIVLARVERWRRFGSGRRHPDLAAAGALPGTARDAQRPLSVEEQLKLALDEFPQARDPIARTLFDLALRMGADGLVKVLDPMDTVIALAAARLAARCTRGLARAHAMPDEARLQGIAVVQDWARRSGKNPFLAVQDGLKVNQAASLSLDASTCVAMAVDLPGGALAPGFTMWEDAEEFHACAALSVRPNLMDDMEFERAQAFASAAARHALAAIEGTAPRPPRFIDCDEPFGPRTVLALTRFALTGGPLPRHSARAAANEAVLRPVDEDGDGIAVGRAGCDGAPAPA
jgi:hypothetical protein